MSLCCMFHVLYTLFLQQNRLTKEVLLRKLQRKENIFTCSASFIDNGGLVKGPCMQVTQSSSNPCSLRSSVCVCIYKHIFAYKQRALQGPMFLGPKPAIVEDGFNSLNSSLIWECLCLSRYVCSLRNIFFICVFSQEYFLMFLRIGVKICSVSLSLP